MMAANEKFKNVSMMSNNWKIEKKIFEIKWPHLPSPIAVAC